MSRIITCKVCGETDDFSTRTGACIDGKYHCQVCYDKSFDDLATEIINNREAVK